MKRYFDEGGFVHNAPLRAALLNDNSAASLLCVYVYVELEVRLDFFVRRMSESKITVGDVEIGSNEGNLVRNAPRRASLLNDESVASLLRVHGYVK